MRGDFITFKELVAMTPWSSSTVSGMVQKGIFKPFRNPLGRKEAKNARLNFYLPAVKETLMKIAKGENVLPPSELFRAAADMTRPRGAA